MISGTIRRLYQYRLYNNYKLFYNVEFLILLTLNDESVYVCICIIFLLMIIQAPTPQEAAVENLKNVMTKTLPSIPDAAQRIAVLRPAISACADMGLDSIEPVTNAKAALLRLEQVLKAQPGYPQPTAQGYPSSYPGSVQPGYPQPTAQGYPSSYPGSVQPGYPQPTAQGYPSSYPGSVQPGYPQPTAQGYPSSYPGSGPQSFPQPTSAQGYAPQAMHSFPQQSMPSFYSQPGAAAFFAQVPPQSGSQTRPYFQGR